MTSPGEANAWGGCSRARDLAPGAQRGPRAELGAQRRETAGSKTPKESSLADLVRLWMRQNRADDRLDPSSLFGRWRDVVGEDIAAHTRIVSADRGELLVEVDSACLLNELSTYYRQEILESMSTYEEFRGIQRLRFRSGTF